MEVSTALALAVSVGVVIGGLYSVRVVEKAVPAVMIAGKRILLLYKGVNKDGTRLCVMIVLSVMAGATEL